MGGGESHKHIRFNPKILATLTLSLLWTNIYAYMLPTYELDTICGSNPTKDCVLDNKYMGNIHLGGALELNKLTFAYMLNVITNDGSLKVNDSININMVTSTLDNKGSIVATNGIIIAPTTQPTAPLGILYNYGTISANNVVITIKDKGSLTNLINHNTINGYVDVKSGGTLGHIYNYGTMGGIIQANKTQANGVEPTNINNFGTINRVNGQAYHLGGGGTFSIKNYAMKITENATTFNQYNGANRGDNSHLVAQQGTTIQFYGGGKLILGLGGDFEYDTEYSLRKLVVDTSGNSVLSVDLAHLELLNKDIFTLMQSGDNFIVSLGGSGGGGSGITTPITATSKANVSSMNNMFLQSNAIMSSNKHKAKFRKMANLNHNRLPRLAKGKSRNDGVGDLDSRTDSPNFIAIDSLKSNESFFYNSDSIYMADARDKAIKSIRQQKDIQTQDSPKDSQSNLSDSNDKYSFLFTPFINHTYFYESGNYSVSGLDGGFITAFSGKINESNTLGTHFAFGYGSLSDKNDKDFNIASANLMLGLNYRLDLIYDMFLKARGDFYYFLNEVGSSSIAKSKPNNAGFGLSVAYGKDFDFAENGVLGLELGLDYKMLSTSDINVKYALDNSNAESYNKAFYNLLYLDLGVNYYKYFSTDSGLWGLDSGLGIRGNLTPKISNGTLMVGNRSVDISLDNDNILAYLNIGGSYVLQSTNFNMEFTLRYNGSFGDKSISNGGSLEWRVSF